MPLHQAIGQLQGRITVRAQQTRGQHVVWSVADAAAARVVLRELRRAQAELAAARELLTAYRYRKDPQ